MNLSIILMLHGAIIKIWENLQLLDILIVMQDVDTHTQILQRKVGVSVFMTVLMLLETLKKKKDMKIILLTVPSNLNGMQLIILKLLVHKI